MDSKPRIRRWQFTTGRLLWSTTVVWALFHGERLEEAKTVADVEKKIATTITTAKAAAQPPAVSATRPGAK